MINRCECVCQLKRKVHLQLYTQGGLCVSLYTRGKSMSFKNMFLCICTYVHACMDMHMEDLRMKFSIIMNLNSTGQFFLYSNPRTHTYQLCDLE